MSSLIASCEVHHSSGCAVLKKWQLGEGEVVTREHKELMATQNDYVDERCKHGLGF